MDCKYCMKHNTSNISAYITQNTTQIEIVDETGDSNYEVLRVVAEIAKTWDIIINMGAGAAFADIDESIGTTF